MILRSSRSIAGLGLLAALAGAPLHAATEAALQVKLKAAIVSKLPQFVQWPPPTLAGRRTVDICVAAPNPFGADLQELVDGESLEGRALAVRDLDRESDLAGCALLYVPGGTLSNRRALLHKAQAEPILTISDDPAFLDEGGIVRLGVVDGRMRFDIDASAARRVGLRISSQLLQLAASVRGGQS